ncbi:hypothetical protein DIPPA_09646 [Diplonema papillatum]|nr:hypothetical protein DIPPA_09646 [Diplonema papillatum]
MSAARLCRRLYASHAAPPQVAMNRGGNRFERRDTYRRPIAGTPTKPEELQYNAAESAARAMRLHHVIVRQASNGEK